jgi:hypothetical protein
MNCGLWGEGGRSGVGQGWAGVAGVALAGRSRRCLEAPSGAAGRALRGGMTALRQWRLLPIRANGQPGAAGYLRCPGDSAFTPFVLTVLRVGRGGLVDIVAFEQPAMFAAFGLPASL